MSIGCYEVSRQTFFNLLHHERLARRHNLANLQLDFPLVLKWSTQIKKELYVRDNTLT